MNVFNFKYQKIIFMVSWLISLSRLINLFIFILSFLFISVFLAVISLSFSDPAFLVFSFWYFSVSVFYLLFSILPFLISNSSHISSQSLHMYFYFACLFFFSFSFLIHIHYLHTSSFIYPVTYRFDPIFSAILNNGYMDIEE